MKKIKRLTVLQALLLLHTAFLVAHGVNFLVGNGACIEEASSTINGMPAHMAGALPRLAGFEYYPLLRPQLPFISGANLLAFIFFCLDCLLLAGLLIKVCFIPHSASLRRTLAFAAMPIAFSIAVPKLESSFSCILSKTQMNIQQIFSGSSDRAEHAVTKRMIDGSSVTIENIATSSSGSFFQMKGDFSEATCNVYVAYLVGDRKESSATYFPLTTQWISLDEAWAPNLLGLRELLIQDPFIKIHAARLKLNIGSMKRELLHSEFMQENSKMRGYSVIACLPWPYGWADQFD